MGHASSDKEAVLHCRDALVMGHGSKMASYKNEHNISDSIIYFFLLTCTMNMNIIPPRQDQQSIIASQTNSKSVLVTTARDRHADENGQFLAVTFRDAPHQGRGNMLLTGVLRLALAELEFVSSTRAFVIYNIHALLSTYHSIQTNAGD